jgi:ribose/xylose/arabinose/galactoside ABC-type transport system permease subunit
MTPKDIPLEVEPTAGPGLRGGLFNGRNLRLGGRDMRGLILFGLVAVVLVVVARTTTDTFFTESNFTNIMRQMVTNGLLSLGMLMVILTGGIDLSVGCVVAFAAISAVGLTYDQLDRYTSFPVPLAMAAAIVTGLLFGSANGILVARFKLAPFVVTLATMTTIRGLTFVFSDVPLRPSADVKDQFRWIGATTVGPVPVAIIVVAVAFALGWVFLNRTPLGRSIVAIGGNRETVRLAGISVTRGIVIAYMICGGLAALAGVILASRMGNVQPSLGVAFELDAIAACVIGGADLAGGKGSIHGTLAGVVILQLMNNLLSLWGVQDFWQQVFKGLIIILVILMQSQARRRN